MKKTIKKLRLERETVRRLTGDSLRGVAGAGTTTAYHCPVTAAACEPSAEQCTGSFCAPTNAGQFSCICQPA